MTTIHNSPYCGSWYPDDPVELKELLAKLFHDSETRTGAAVLPDGIAYVAPHAGLVYSGTVAAAVCRHVRARQPKRIIIAGFSHSNDFAGIRIPQVSAYATSAGETETDWRAMEYLSGGEPFHLAPEGVVCDHSVEIQLPLLEAAAPEARVVPLFVGRLSSQELERAADRLARILDAETVLLASSDFTHYGRAFGYLPFPNDRWTSEHLRDLDDDLIEAAGSLDVAFFEKELRRTQATLCGRGPISLLLAVLHKLPGEEIFQEKLDYQTSGEITGDWGHSVSYAALGYFRQQSFCLDEEDRRLLIDSARRTLATYDWGRSATPVPPAVNTPALSRKCGAFVSLHHKGRLMGCIGCREGADPLHTSVPELAISALHDPRFQPPTPQEVAEADLEISVLTPMKRLPDPAHLQAGIHGAYLEAGGHQGLLLPQVATEYGMSRDEFLRALTKKAGASQDACHRPDAKLYVFQAQRFGG